MGKSQVGWCQIVLPCKTLKFSTVASLPKLDTLNFMVTSGHDAQSSSNILKLRCQISICSSLKLQFSWGKYGSQRHGKLFELMELIVVPSPLIILPIRGFFPQNPKTNQLWESRRNCLAGHLCNFLTGQRWQVDDSRVPKDIPYHRIQSNITQPPTKMVVGSDLFLVFKEMPPKI